MRVRTWSRTAWVLASLLLSVGVISPGNDLLLGVVVGVIDVVVVGVIDVVVVGVVGGAAVDEQLGGDPPLGDGLARAGGADEEAVTVPGHDLEVPGAPLQAGAGRLGRRLLRRPDPG